MSMRVLVVGGGGREHAIAWKLSRSPLLQKLYCCPGNPGTAEIAENVDLPLSNLGSLALWAVENKIDLTVVGPEAPLAAGLCDIFAQHGLRVFGPTKEAAQLESSKSYAKEIMLKVGVNTPHAVVFEEHAAARDYLQERGAPIVIKADGLASGKGVTVATTLEQAMAAIDECFVGARFGESGKRVVVEDFIEGKEASVMAIVDGTTVLPLVVSQDYKRLLDGDGGPNTGGMGAISPTPVLSDGSVENLVGDIFVPVLRELWTRGLRYVGFLYAGVIIDAKGGVSVLEFNCRLGDPETQVLLPRMKSDLLFVLDAAVNGRLSSVELQWHTDSAACVVVSSRGYPAENETGFEIRGIFPNDDETMLFQAGTSYLEGDKSKIVNSGGRVLAVSALGGNLNEALRKAYAGVERVSFEGMYYRKDIGGGSW